MGDSLGVRSGVRGRGPRGLRGRGFRGPSRPSIGSPYAEINASFLANYVAADLSGADDSVLTAWPVRDADAALSLESGTNCVLKTSAGPGGGKCVEYGDAGTATMAAPADFRTAITTADAATFFAVIQTDSQSPLGFCRTGGSANNPHWPFNYTDLYTEFLSASRSPGITTAVDLTEWHIAALRRTTANNVSVWINGTQLWVGGLGAMSARTPILPLYASSGVFRVAEQVWFTAGIPNLAMGDVTDLLAARYGISV